MELPSDWTDGLGVALASARRRGSVVELSLDGVLTQEQAEAVQAAAVGVYGGVAMGYSIEATSTLSQRQTCCDAPIFGPILDLDMLPSGARFRLPRGVIGAGCSFVFVVARPYPAEGEGIDRSSVSQAVVDCRLAINILGRRVSGSAPLSALTATADFALNVLHAEGPRVPNFADLDVEAPVTASRRPFPGARRKDVEAAPGKLASRSGADARRSAGHNDDLSTAHSAPTA